MGTELTQDSEASRSDQGQPGRGRGARAFGARVVGVLLLALGLGLGYTGVDSALYEPFAEVTPGTITVDRCTHNDNGGRESVKECEGEFVSDDGENTMSYVDVETDEPYPRGRKVDVVEVGEYTYFRSVVGAVASGLRYLFGGFCALGPAFFCLIGGRWPGLFTAGVLRSMHPALSRFTFPLVGIGILGFIVASIVMDAAA